MPDAAQADAPVDAQVSYHYVVNRLVWPTTSTEARDDGFDLDGNGSVDNQLGQIMATYFSMGFDVQPASDTAVAQGATITLADVETYDLTAASDASFTTFIGVNPLPPPCNGSADTVCGHHLTGTGSFGVSPVDPRDPAIPGAITGGVFAGGPGDLTVPVFALGATPASLRLLGAHARFTPTPGGLSGIIGGAIAQDDRDFILYPTIVASLEQILGRDCTGPQNPPGCGCASQSQGASVIALFDANQDCMLTVDEFANNSMVMTLFATDVTVEHRAALSVGFAFTAVDATFTP